MTRIAYTCLATVLVLLNIAVAAYAMPDEELYVLQHATGTLIKLTRLDVSAGGGISKTDIVTFDSSGSGVTFIDVLNSEGVFYVLGSAGNPIEWKLYTLDTSDGDLTSVGSLNVDHVSHIFKNPADGTVWVTYDDDNDGAHLPEAVAQIDLSDAQVDTNTIISLASPRFFQTAFFDAFGNLYGVEYSANTSWTHWWFKVNESTGALSPDCPPGGGFSPCWQGVSNSGFTLTNPDTNETIGFVIVDAGYTYDLSRLEFYDTFMGATSLGEILSDQQIIGATYAPNVQSEIPPLPPPHVYLGGMCM